MNEIDTKQLADRISREIEFNLRPDEKHLLAEAIGCYFENYKQVDVVPRPGTLLKEIEKLKKASKKLSDQISNLHSSTIATIASFRSVKDDRDVNLVLEDLSDSASWLSEKTERVLHILHERKPPDKGGPKKNYARRILVYHLIGIYERATGNPAAYGTDNKSGERNIGPFGRFVHTCLKRLGLNLSVSAIDAIIREPVKHSKIPIDPTHPPLP